MSPAGLCSLRKAAVLAHAVSSLGLMVGHRGSTIATVCQHDLMAEPRVLQLHPCGFRRAVCDAYREHLAGHEIQIRGLPLGTDPELNFFALTDCEVRNDGLIRCVVERGDVILLFATVIEASAVRALLDVRFASPDCLLSIECVDDDDLGASLVFVRLRADEIWCETYVLEVLRDVVAAFGVEEITAPSSPYRVPSS